MRLAVLGRVDTERMVKYIANRPAKNISSLASHTMVPTEVMFGRVTGPWAANVPVAWAWVLE